VYRLPFLRLIRPRGYAPVGHLGVEPSYTALSERPLRPDGPWPMNLARRRGGRYAHGHGDRHGCSKPTAAPAVHLPREESDGLEPSRSSAHPLSGRRPRP
jgi:hypothetical protein